MSAPLIDITSLSSAYGQSQVLWDVDLSLQRGQVMALWPLNPGNMKVERNSVGDLIYIDTLCDYMMRACEAKKLALAYNLTNAEPVRITDFLLKVLRELDLPEPKRSISIKTAWIAAGLIEQIYSLLHLRGEPPVTRFGVSVFAYSKTFNPSRTISDLGLPSVSVSEGLRRFIDWQKEQPC